MIFRSVRLMGALPVVFSCLSCVPWVVRPIDDSEQDEETGREVLDAELYVASIWDERVIPAVENEAVEIQDAAGGSECRLVRGEGKIVRVDRESRAGRLFLDLPPYGGGPDAVHGPGQPGEQLRSSISSARLRRDLGVAVETSIDDGLRSTASWFRAQLGTVG